MYALAETKDSNPIDYDSYTFESVDSYKAYTNFPFLLSEVSLVARLLQDELSFNRIKQQVTLRDILQIRSKASRQGAFRSIEQLLKDIPPPYIQFLATGNSDLRRYTLLFVTLRINRLLREVISEVLLDRLKGLDNSLDRQTMAAFFDIKSEQEITIGEWSKSTYQKVYSNTVLILVRSGLLFPSKNKKTYQIQANIIPVQLKKQLLNDGLGVYVKLMLN